MYCLKNNDVDSDENEHRSSAHRQQPRQNRHRAQHRPTKHEQTSNEITVISGTHRHEGQSQPSPPKEYDPRKLSTQAQSIGLADSTNSGFGIQLPQSPLKTSSFAYNQSDGLMPNPNQISASNTNIKRDSYNRH